MKILHSLVGYLVVTALPFYPFAFASPLAAFDYDGYVTAEQLENHIEIALMNRFIGNIVETCQTATTRNYGDTAVMKRSPGDIIDARQVEGAVGYVPEVLFIVNIVAVVTLSILWVKDDDPVRGDDISLYITLIKSLLLETCGVYPRYYQQCHCEVSTFQLGHLSLPLFCCV